MLNFFALSVAEWKQREWLNEQVCKDSNTILER